MRASSPSRTNRHGLWPGVGPPRGLPGRDRREAAQQVGHLPRRPSPPALTGGPESVGGEWWVVSGMERTCRVVSPRSAAAPHGGHGYGRVTGSEGPGPSSRRTRMRWCAAGPTGPAVELPTCGDVRRSPGSALSATASAGQPGDVAREQRIAAEGDDVDQICATIEGADAADSTRRRAPKRPPHGQVPEEAAAPSGTDQYRGTKPGAEQGRRIDGQPSWSRRRRR